MNTFLRSTSLVLTFAGLLCSQALAGDAAGMIKTLKGSAQVERGARKIPAAVGTEVFPGDLILTAANSAVGITLRDNTQLSAGASSTLAINKFEFNTTTNAGAVDATVKRGTLSVISGKIAKASPDAVRFNTATVTLGVRGTEFIIEAGDSGEATP